MNKTFVFTVVKIAGFLFTIAAAAAVIPFPQIIAEYFTLSFLWTVSITIAAIFLLSAFSCDDESLGWGIGMGVPITIIIACLFASNLSDECVSYFKVVPINDSIELKVPYKQCMAKTYFHQDPSTFTEYYSSPSNVVDLIVKEANQ